ncbi:hypothetical protein A71_118 [Escherichia phage A7_1]|uniref:Uncharacterized protein n=2 Tax=Vequintavirinae TaxID=1911928 RepID=A0AAE9VYP4_9CAUD|nr:putative structural protein 2 [Escherichia phage UPEC06]UZZ63924.1 hypothetical protein A71_118 [Escherichia phage A7_1]UZZ64196.1 hypothetical protein A54_232 [Escherichia phage A5-4]WBF77553.1 hypothetical protein A73_137 [Escherichia phage A73]WBF77817.1 hypothetical protein W70_123 [Escherichia phage W70]
MALNPKLISLQAYDPAKVLIFIGGQRVSGFAADTKVVVSRNNDNITPLSGVDGEVSSAIVRDNSGVVTISLQNTSVWNGYLSQWQLQARLTGLVYFPIQIEGSQGLSLNTFGWIQRQPDLTYGSEVGQMDWEIGVVDAQLSADQIQGVAAGIGGILGLDQ